MRPMEITSTDTTVWADRPPLLNLRWSGIFAGLVVGIAINLLLMLIGAAVGLAALNVAQPVNDATIPAAAALWNTVSMLLAAFFGAYVAARSAGLRRRSDGVLHGVVAWGVTLLVSAFVAGSATGAAIGSLFAGQPGGASAAAQAASGITEGNRAEAASILQQRLGLSTEQANRIVDQAMVLSGHERGVSPADRADTEQTLHVATVASGWLSVAVVLSLLAAVGGGMAGARGARRHDGVAVQRRTTTVHTPPSGRAGPPADTAPV